MVMQQRDVTLQPGQQTTVGFSFTPTEARQYGVNVEGLTGTFTAHPVVTDWWRPPSAYPIHWQWQIGTPFNPSQHMLPNVTVYDIDAFDNTASVVATLRNAGCIAIAYISFGSYENWRPDAASFPAYVLGNNLSGWPGERWLDIRSDAVKTIMRARLDMAKAKGFHAVEPDCIDGYINNTGFPLTKADQLNYNRWIADECHKRGLSVGLKNCVELIVDLEPYFDWTLNEECNRYRECGYLSRFVNNNKAAFQCEYRAQDLKCAEMNKARVNSMRRDLGLTATGIRVPCIPDTQHTW